MSSTQVESTQAQSPVISHDVFNPATQVNYLKPKTNKSGGKAVGIRLMLECPLMLTWGANKFTDEVSGRSTYKMSLAFPRSEYSTPETDKFLKAMLAMENKIKEDATKNSVEWFNKPKDKMQAAVVDALFNPMLKWPKDPMTGDRDMTKTPTLDIKLEYYEGFNCELYDVNGTMLFPDKTNPEVTPLTLLPKLTNIACIIQCGGIWFAGGKFGVTWKLFQGVVQPRPSLKGKCLIKLSSSAAKVLSKPIEDEHEDLAEDSNVGTMELANDSDVEDEVVVQPTQPKPVPVQAAPAQVQVAPAVQAQAAPAQVQEEPAAKPKVVKKVVRKQ
jgi:hypothetical protein